MSDVRIGTCRICGNGLISGSGSNVCPQCKSRAHKLAVERNVSDDDGLLILESIYQDIQDPDFDWNAALGPQFSDEDLKTAKRTGRGRVGHRSIDALDPGTYSDDQFIDDALRLRKEAMAEATGTVVASKTWVCPNDGVRLDDKLLRNNGIIEDDMKPICPRCGHVMEG